MFPLGLSAPLVDVERAAANDTYKVHYEENGYVYDGYFLATLPAQWRVDQTIWDHLTASNLGDPLKLALSRYDGVERVAVGARTLHDRARELARRDLLLDDERHGTHVAHSSGHGLAARGA